MRCVSGKSMIFAGLAVLALGLGGSVRADEGPAKSVGDAPAQPSAPGSAGADSVPALPAGAAKPGEYWLGVLCFEPEPALRSQLRLPENHGLLVVRVVPDSPAGKAGLCEHDVLMKAGGKPLGKASDLIEVVEAAKETKVNLELIRGGQTMKVDVQPQKRPPDTAPMSQGDENDWKALRRWMDPLVPGGPPVRFQFYHPGMILPPETSAFPPLPNNMSVTVTRQGSQPAKIIVQQGDQHWELTEKDLDKLPQDVRPHVQRMLAPSFPMNIIPPERSGASQAASAPDSEASEIESRLQRQLDSMSEHFDRLRKEVEELRRQASPPSPEKPADR